MLDQNRLDVAAKTRSNIFNWRGQFTPQFVDYLMERFATAATSVVDPFCGSGTVLLESASRGIAAYGTELHPAAYAMAKFATLSSLSMRQRLNLRDEVESQINHVAVHFEDYPLWQERATFRDSAKNLLQFGQLLLSRCDSELQTLIVILVLFETESMRHSTLLSALRRAFRGITGHLLQLPRLDVAPEVFWCDARAAHKVVQTPCDLLITSPPYINVFNYHQNHRAVVELLGFDVLQVAKSEIGSNRRNRGNRFKTVVQYALDMEQCLRVFSRVLKDDGTAVVIVGRESRVRGVPFKNGQIIMDLATEGNLLHVRSLHERKYINRFGTRIFEDILVLGKEAGGTPRAVGRMVAERTLKQAAAVAPHGVGVDIGSALEDLNSIPESPVMHRRCHSPGWIS